MGSPALEDPPVTTEASTIDRGGGSRRRLRAAALAAVLLALAAVAAVALSSRSPSHAGPATGVPAGQTTTTVTRRTLTESSTVNGTLGYSGSSELYDRLSSAGTFTWLPAVGAVIERGGTLFRVNDLPVALMYGAVPAYRTLKQGVGDGLDVSELNRNLIALGYDPYGAIGDDDHFGEATAAAVRRWQQAEGLSQSGEVELGRVVFAPGAQRVTKVHVALGQDPPGEAGAGGPASKERAAKEEKPTKENTAEDPAKDKAKERPKEKASKEPASKKEGPRSKEKGGASKGPSSKKPASHESAASKESAPKENGGTPKANGGTGGGAGTLVLSTTSTRQVVQLKVKASQQQLARVGESAPVTLPDGEVVRGHIATVGTVASESSENEKEKPGNGGGNGNANGGGENATISVTLALAHPVAHLDQAPVSVALVKSVRRDVLTVPATALIATAGGGYAVQALEGNRRVALPVTPGMFANGYVEVEGPGIHEGLTVLESQ
jgi:peptidoglycan hydrolase-like protein with peptidoglycan-binding domain